MAAVIPVIAVVASVASTAYSVYSSTQARHEARHEEHITEGLAENTANLEAQRAKKAEEERRRRVLSSQRALYGAAGLEMEGSPLLVQAETIRNSEENLRQIEENRTLKLAGYQSNLKAEETASYNTSISSAMKGVGTVYNIGRTYSWW